MQLCFTILFPFRYCIDSWSCLRVRGIGARYFLYSVYEVLEEEVIIIELITKKSNFGVSTFFSLDCLLCVKYASKMGILYASVGKIGYKWLFFSLCLVLRCTIDCYLTRLGNACYVGYTTFLSRLYRQLETAFKFWRIGCRTFWLLRPCHWRYHSTSSRVYKGWKFSKPRPIGGCRQLLFGIIALRLTSVTFLP